MAELECPSRCETDAGLCQVKLNGKQYAQLVLIAAAAILVALLFAGRDRERSSDEDGADDCAEDSDDDSDDDEPACYEWCCEHACCRHPLTLRAHQFCHGIGRFFSAKFMRNRKMMTLFFVALAAFLVGFFGLHSEKYPCATALGGCSTISCVCANYYGAHILSRSTISYAARDLRYRRLCRAQPKDTFSCLWS